MKRVGNLWYSKIATRENVRNSIKMVLHLCEDINGNLYFSPQRKKSPSNIEMEIFNHLNETIEEIYQSLINRNYDFGKVHNFKIKEISKIREINHLDKHGAILLQCVLNVCQPYFIKKYIPFTYSSIVGRGLTDCSKRIKGLIKKHKGGYALQLDVHHCYATVDHTKMMESLSSTIKDIYVLEFFERLISLVNPGLAIGFSTNHYFVNLLFTPLDHLMIDSYKFDYTRYMDDILVICDTKEECWNAFKIINEEVEKLNMHIKHNYRVFPIRCGFDYCGYVYYETHTLLRKSLKDRIRKRDRKLRENNCTDKEYHDSMVSYYGWCKWCDSKNFMQKIFSDKLYTFDKK